MSAEFVGKWAFESSDNFDEYLKQVGVGLITRKVAANLKPSLEFKVSGDHWTITSTSTFKTFDIDFDLNKEFEETTADGRTLKSTFTFENGKLVQQQKKINPKDKDSVIERYIENGKLVITMDSEGVKAKRVYTKDV